MRQRSWIIALLVVGFALFLIILNFKKQVSLWNAVPSNSALVLRNNFEQLDSLPNLFFIQQIKKDHQLLNNFNLPKNQEILTVLQTGTPDGFNALFITKKGSAFQAETINQNLQTSQLQGVEVFRNNQFAFAQHKGLLLIAPHAMQVESAIQQLNSGQTISKTPLSDTQKEIFLFPRNTDYFLTPLVESSFRNPLRFLKTTDGAVSGDLQLFDQGFIFKGSITNTFPQLSPEVFDSSKALSVLPDNTIFCFRGKLDFKRIREQIQAFLLDYAAENWFGNEMILGKTASSSGKFLILELSEQGKIALEALEENNKMLVKQHLMFKTYNITRQQFFTYDDRYLYLFEEEKNLQTWINKYSTGKILQNEVNIQQLQAQITDSQYNFFYFNTRKFKDNIEEYVRSDWKNTFLEDEKILGNNAHLLATFKQSADSTKIELHALKQSEQIAEQTAEVLLPIELKSEAIIAPQFISSKNQKYLFTQDKEHRLYAFDLSGNLLWEKELEDQIISKIHLLQDGNLLFNTTFRVHLCDLEGLAKEGYPFELQPKAILGLCLVDFTQSGRYHYLLACENGSIYGYDLEGNTLEGWGPKDSVGSNITSIQHFQNTERDFLLVAADSTIQVYNRLGELRFPVYVDSTLWDAPIAYQTGSNFPRIAATDNRNRVHIINLEGVSFKLPLNKKLDNSFQFLFLDVWGDERKEYLYLSGKRLLIYAYDEENKFKLRSEVELEHAQDTIFGISYAEKNWIGMVSKSANQINLYDGKGNQHPAFPLAGEQAFSIENELLITSDQEQILMYLLE